MATPDTVLHVTKVGGCCPATEPEVVRADAAPVPPPDSASRSAGTGVLVSVVDTGWHPPATRWADWLDGVTGDVGDEDRLRSDVRHAAALGFSGKLCIHPRQVPVAEAELAPTEEDVRWARSVLEGVEAAEGPAVVVVDGKMVDKPVVDRARRILGDSAPPPP